MTGRCQCVTAVETARIGYVRCQLDGDHLGPCQAQAGAYEVEWSTAVVIDWEIDRERAA